MKWAWKGPLEGGITQSLIQKFEEDPFCFVLYYGLGLEEAAQENQNLIWGNAFHKGLEVGLRNPTRFRQFSEADWYEIRAAVTEDCKNFLHANRTTPYSVMNMLPMYNDGFKVFLPPGRTIATEQQFKIPHHTGKYQVSLMGKKDGIFLDDQDRLTLIEHKCKGSHDKVKLRQEIKHDVQVNLYCHASGARRVIYDVILIPEAQWKIPAARITEAPSAYINRIYHTATGDNLPISRNAHHWLDQYTFELSDSQIERVFTETINPIIDRICRLYEETQSDSFDPFNPECFSEIYYKRPIRFFDPARTTQFEKSYYQFLTGSITLEHLKPATHLFKELEGEG